MGESKKKSRSMATQRAWSLVRMALLWGRKGGIFKRMSWHHMFELRNLFSKHLKTLNHHHDHNNNRSISRYYGEKQLSFDETPIFNVKINNSHHRTGSMRFLLPCIAPPVDFDYDFGMDGGDDDNIDGYYDERCDRAVEIDCKEEEEEEKGVDLRAEEFIANFYKQMKLQRQISYLEYKTESVNDVVQ